MKLVNHDGQTVYYNLVIKSGQPRYIVKAVTGQTIPSRDRKPLKSRTFKRDYQAEAWLASHGYKCDVS